MRRITPATVLIVLIFGTTSVLAWQAYESTRSHLRSAERVLSDYAQFAGWEFGRVAKASLDEAVGQWAQPVALSQSSSLMTPAEFNARPDCKCQNLQAVTTFRMSGDRLETSGEALTAATKAWLATFARTPQDPEQPHRHVVLRIDVAGGRARAIVAKSAHQHNGGLVPVAGIVMDVQPVARVLRGLVEGRPLLPPTLAGPRNELLSVTVRTPDGVVILPGAPVGAATARVEGALDDTPGGLRYEVILKPEAAARLVIGGLPRSRLPVLLGLLGLTAALAVAALLQLRREQQLAGLRSDFVSSVSHELRTPLAQIRLFSETLLLNRVRSASEGRRALEIIQQESRRLTHLVENVLFFSRGERGIERIATAPMPLAPLVSELVEAFVPLARAARSEVRVEVREAVDALVDPAAFRQILLNLLDNAVKYGRPGQTIVVAVERRGPSALVTVSDEGPGVPPAARAKIWAPYARLVTAATTAVAGTGIGLAVVRQLVRLHGGSVGVEDAPGGGARFVVALRAADPEAGALPAGARRATA